VSPFNEPTSATELLLFFGVQQFFYAHIDHLAEMAAPLYQVLEGTKWNAKKPTKTYIIKIEEWDDRWNEKASEDFKWLRDVLAHPLFLVPAHPGERKRLCADASRYGLGAALLQDEGEKGWLPIGFASRKLKGAEARYTTTDMENLAVIFGLKNSGTWCMESHLKWWPITWRSYGWCR
jgi:RNase H-like domain found in reverse transcriptase